MSNICWIPTPVHASGVYGPIGVSAQRCAVGAQKPGPEKLPNKPPTMGTFVTGQVSNKLLATLSHAVRDSMVLLNGRICESNMLPCVTNLFFAAIDCEWGMWGEWSDCSKACGDGVLTRKRVHSIFAQYGGQNCTGEQQVTQHCNVMDDLKKTIAQQEQTIKDLTDQLYPSKSCHEKY